MINAIFRNTIATALQMIRDVYHTRQTGMSANRKNTDYSKFTNEKCDRQFARYCRSKGNKLVFIAGGEKCNKRLLPNGNHKNVRFTYTHFKLNLLNLNVFQDKSSVRCGLHVIKRIITAEIFIISLIPKSNTYRCKSLYVVQ